MDRTLLEAVRSMLVVGIGVLAIGKNLDPGEGSEVSALVLFCFTRPLLPADCARLSTRGGKRREILTLLERSKVDEKESAVSSSCCPSFLDGRSCEPSGTRTI